MFLGPGLISFHAGAAPASPAMRALTAGVPALIAVATVAAVATWRHRARVGPSATHLPRRGSSAVLMCAICAVLFVLVSASQRQIPSLTIVSHAARPPVTAARSSGMPGHGGPMSALKRPPSGASTGRFAGEGGRAQNRRRCPVPVHPVVGAARLAWP